MCMTYSKPRFVGGTWMCTIVLEKLVPWTITNPCCSFSGLLLPCYFCKTGLKERSLTSTGIPWAQHAMPRGKHQLEYLQNLIQHLCADLCYFVVTSCHLLLLLTLCHPCRLSWKTPCSSCALKAQHTMHQHKPTAAAEGAAGEPDPQQQLAAAAAMMCLSLIACLLLMTLLLVCVGVILLVCHHCWLWGMLVDCWNYITEITGDRQHGAVDVLSTLCYIDSNSSSSRVLQIIADIGGSMHDEADLQQDILRQEVHRSTQ